MSNALTYATASKNKELIGKHSTCTNLNDNVTLTKLFFKSSLFFRGCDSLFCRDELIPTKSNDTTRQNLMNTYRSILQSACRKSSSFQHRAEQMNNMTLQNDSMHSVKLQITARGPSSIARDTITAVTKFIRATLTCEASSRTLVWTVFFEACGMHCYAKGQINAYLRMILDASVAVPCKSITCFANSVTECCSRENESLLRM